jgi:F0F1-type ATP synthase assembly protein I
MDLHLADINWLAVVVSVIVAQIISTVWYVAIFGNAWARVYGVPTRQQHTKEVPGYTYAVQALCTIVLTVTLAVFMRAVGVESLAGGLTVGLLVAVGFCVATGLPGQAFLKRWRTAALALGSQVVMILAIAAILGGWR